MIKKKLLITVFLLSATMLFASSAQAWPESDIYVQKVSTSPIIDGQLDPGEWKTDEEVFTDTVSLNFDAGTISEVKYNIVVIVNETHIFFRILFELQNSGDYVGNVSLGIGIADQSSIGAMSDTLDRKLMFHNSTSQETELFDLHNCALTSCDVLSDIQPGRMDNSSDFSAAYGEDGETYFFEVAMPMTNDAFGQDIDIKEGVTFEIVINPYVNLFEVSSGGHGAVASSDLSITFEEKSFFPRPEGPMDGLAKFFNAVFAIFIVILSLAVLLGPRVESIGKKLWRVEVTEEMAHKSILMEIANYNSSFLALFAMFYFWLYSVIAVIYGVWANWATDGFIINGPPAILSTLAMIDLIRHNHNPQDIPVEERKVIGSEVQKSPKLWIIPVIFLGLTLFMLVFIGIDVVS